MRNPKDVFTSSYHYHNMASFLVDPNPLSDFLDKFLSGKGSYCHDIIIMYLVLMTGMVLMLMPSSVFWLMVRPCEGLAERS